MQPASRAVGRRRLLPVESTTVRSWCCTTLLRFQRARFAGFSTPPKRRTTASRRATRAYLVIADAASFFAADELRSVGDSCTGVGVVFARRHRTWCCGRCRPSSTRAWLIGSACDVIFFAADELPLRRVCSYWRRTGLCLCDVIAPGVAVGAVHHRRALG